MKHVAEVIAYGCAILFMVAFTAFVVSGCVYNIVRWHKGEDDGA